MRWVTAWRPALTPGGIFHNDTRYLSGVQLLIDGQRPLLLSSAVENDNVVLTVDLSNPDIYQGHAIVLPREILHMRRSKFLWHGACYERIAIHNFDARPQKCWLTINFAADFADLFEVRGIQRKRRGDITCAVIGGAKTIFRYHGPGQDRTAHGNLLSTLRPGNCPRARRFMAWTLSRRTDRAGDDGSLHRHEPAAMARG